MDLILELIRLVETLPAAWNGLVQTIRDLAHALLPPELDYWLATNEWALWVAMAIAALIVIVTIAGALGGE